VNLYVRINSAEGVYFSFSLHLNAGVFFCLLDLKIQLREELIKKYFLQQLVEKSD
jgi:hypothetical protein